MDQSDRFYSPTRACPTAERTSKQANERKSPEMKSRVNAERKTPAITKKKVRKEGVARFVLCNALPLCRPAPSSTACASRGTRSLQEKNGSLFLECFPYVCPEPVWVKRSFLCINGSKSTVFAHHTSTANPRPEERARRSPTPGSRPKETPVFG